MSHQYRNPEGNTRYARSHKPREIGLKIFVFDLDTDQQIRELTVRHFDSSKRKWLTQLIVWASFNRKSVEIISLNDDRKEYEPAE